MAYLVLLRHGLTAWNKEGRWQGFTDTPISDEGKAQIKKAAEAIKDINFDIAFTSNLLRTQETFQVIKNTLQLNCPVNHDSALNERDYGIYTGKNKWEVEREIGQSEFKKLRRNFDYPVPAGETLKNVYERVVPFYNQKVLTLLKTNKNVLLVSSGNTFRALIKYLENLTDKEVADLDLGFGNVWIYQIDQNGQVIKKEIKKLQ